MKNVHLITTNKPSKMQRCELSEWFDINKENLIDDRYKWQHLYITSDVEIKEGDGKYPVLGNKSTIYKDCPDLWKSSGDWKKIILTTDQDLIADGVQAIDDEFLEWFVKNPSCEFVEIIYGLFNPMGRQVDPNNLGQNHSQCIWKHKIIIPQEKPKEETIEEAASKYAKKSSLFTFQQNHAKDFIAGAKWQKEQILQFLYSEITERRDYSASKMCEKIVEFIEQTTKNNPKTQETNYQIGYRMQKEGYGISDSWSSVITTNPNNEPTNEEIEEWMNGYHDAKSENVKQN